MRKKRGSNLVDYALPTALIGVVAGIAFYNIVKDESIVKNILANVDGTKKQTKMIVNPRTNPGNEVKPGSLGGTPENPKMKCTMGTCDIDYGNYILQGIPQEMTDITTAGRGGELTDVYASMLEQLAAQLEDIDASQSDVLNRLAKEARKMAFIEHKIEENIARMNNTQQKIYEQAGTPVEKINNLLGTIDPKNLEAKDGMKILGSARFLNKSGIITDKQMSNTFAAVMSIQKSYPNISVWQENVLNTIINTPDKISNAIDIINTNLTESEQNVFLNENNSLYNVVTNKLDLSMNAVNSTSATGPGYNFNKILTTEVPSAGLSSDVLAIVGSAAAQIQTIADNLDRQEQPLGPNTLIEKVVIPENAGIETKIAANVINKA